MGDIPPIPAISEEGAATGANPLKSWGRVAMGNGLGNGKQVTTTGAVRGDPVLLLSRSEARTKKQSPNVWKVAEQLRLDASRALDPDEQTVQRLYSRLVTHYLTLHQQVPLDAESFYRWHAGQPATEILASAGD